MIRPYPPGNVKVNNVMWPTTMLGQIALTWAHRDRMQQTVYLVTQAEGNIGPGGRFPVNTGGGQLSGGRLHGFGLMHEVCLQLWGEAEGRQVAGASTGVCGMGGGFIAGAMLLNRT